MDLAREKARVAVLQRNLSLYFEGATGIGYEDLLHFSEPLFHLYELDLRSAAQTQREREAVELAGLVSLLDLARLLWAYFLLEPAQASSALGELRSVLLGPVPEPDEIRALDELLDLMEERWAASHASASGAPDGYALPSFHELLRDYERADPGNSDHQSDPSMPSDLPDALASFALPLFESADLEDPAAIDDALARAQAYWELAQTSGPAYELRLDHLAERFSSNWRTEEAVREEATAMTRRYRELFG